MSYRVRNKVMRVLESIRNESPNITTEYLADVLVDSGLLFDPEIDIRPKFKIGQTVFRIYNTRGCENCTRKNLECDGIECPEPKINAMRYCYEDINTVHEMDIFATQEEALAILKDRGI